MPWNEDELHRWLLAQPPPRGLVGSRGHDGAVLRIAPGRPVLCADQTVEGVHFERGSAPDRIGRKAVGRVLSDLAACGARPRAIVLALSAPPAEHASRLKAILRAVRETARRHGADLVGGDLSCAEAPLALAVTGYGTAPPGRPVGRDRARPGDAVLCTGRTGGSRLGRHLDVVPRLAEGRWLAESGARALMDVSDGLAIDLERIARASGVRIDLETVPVHEDARRLARRTGRAPEWHALFDGEDHELIATAPARVADRLVRNAGRRFPGLARIGSVRAGRGLWIPSPDGGRLRRWRRGGGEGWIHGER